MIDLIPKNFSISNLPNIKQLTDLLNRIKGTNLDVSSKDGKKDLINGLSDKDVVEFSFEAKMLNVSILVQKGSEEKVKLNIQALKLDIAFSKRRNASYFDDENTYEDIDKKYSDEVNNLDEKLGEWSTERVSDRVVDFAKAIYEGLLMEDGDPETKEKLEKYKKLIKDAINKGFEEARQELGDIDDVLKELQQKTYDKIMKKLDDYFDKRLNDNNTEILEDDSIIQQEFNFEYTNISLEYTKYNK